MDRDEALTTPGTEPDDRRPAWRPDASSSDAAWLLMFFADENCLDISHVKYSMLELGEMMGRMHDRLSAMYYALSRMEAATAGAPVRSWMTETTRCADALVSASGEQIGVLMDAVRHYRSLPSGDGKEAARRDIDRMHAVIEATTMRLRTAGDGILEVTRAIGRVDGNADTEALRANLAIIQARMRSVTDDLRSAPNPPLRRTGSA
ncbi:MAG: hypothetical protein LIQ30_01135 [Planctomycetes bacterium]|nr:hypothetical protein [Planctomycetota bacterium]MCC8116037.1 hypothetical protein [Planctomycetota bacterium]MCD7895063.1 hypothetical protein [Planctomycetaceae bacterium]